MGQSLPYASSPHVPEWQGRLWDESAHAVAEAIATLGFVFGSLEDAATGDGDPDDLLTDPLGCFEHLRDLVECECDPGPEDDRRHDYWRDCIEERVDKAVANECPEWWDDIQAARKAQRYGNGDGPYR